MRAKVDPAAVRNRLCPTVRIGLGHWDRVELGRSGLGARPGGVAEQRISGSLEGDEPVRHDERAADVHKSLAVEAVAKLRGIFEEVALGPKPDAAAREGDA